MYVEAGGGGRGGGESACVLSRVNPHGRAPVPHAIPSCFHNLDKCIMLVSRRFVRSPHRFLCRHRRSPRPLPRRSCPLVKSSKVRRDVPWGQAAKGLRLSVAHWARTVEVLP